MQLKNRPGAGAVSVIIVIALIALVIILGLRLQEAQSRDSVTVPVDEQSAEQNQEEADRIVAQLRKIYSIPEDIDPTVATIVDVETLRERNPFYASAQNGDHLIVTLERAILYSSEKGQILDVVPIQVQQAK